MDDTNLINFQSSPNVFYPPQTIVCTASFSRFLREYHANLDFFFFVIGLTTSVDRTRVTAAKAILPGVSETEKRIELEASIVDPDRALNKLADHSPVQSKNLTNGIVSAFQRYFSAIISAAALKRPEMLSSSEKISISDVLLFTRHKDLVSFLVDRKINELSYGGLSEMEKYFNDRLGISMFLEDRQRILLRLFVEARNINVHNGGIVNDLFLSRAGQVDGFSYSKGKRFHIGMDELVTLSENAMRVAMQIDAAVSEKFCLRRNSHEVWKRPGK